MFVRKRTPAVQVQVVIAPDVCPWRVVADAKRSAFTFEILDNSTVVFVDEFVLVLNGSVTVRCTRIGLVSARLAVLLVRGVLDPIRHCSEIDEINVR